MNKSSINPGSYPTKIGNWICGKELWSHAGKSIDKLNPCNGDKISELARSNGQDVDDAVDAAKTAQSSWAGLPVVKRGEILYQAVGEMNSQRHKIAHVVHLETGKSMKDALGETDGAISLARFFAGESQRFFGRTTTSSISDRLSFIIRQPIGIVGLIVAANTPIANVAWKVFPSLICGNSCVVKAPEDTPGVVSVFAKILMSSGLPNGVLNVIQGFGIEAGEPLVVHPDIGVISFTGSAEVGKRIGSIAGGRLAKVSLELGGKNPLVVCDDADIKNAVKWTLLSAFSNAGQRCASASRIIIFDSIYDRFKNALVKSTANLRLGNRDEDDFGPVINERQLNRMLAVVEEARTEGANILHGGKRLTDDGKATGFFMSPTIIEDAHPQSNISVTELFGPITCLYRATGFEEALELANSSPYGLTACIHTRSIDRAIEFSKRVQAGVTMVNAGTFGSEPHMPFGGVKQSGNGTREPGPEALDVYSQIKNISINVNRDHLENPWENQTLV